VRGVHCSNCSQRILITNLHGMSGFAMDKLRAPSVNGTLENLSFHEPESVSSTNTSRSFNK